MSIHLASCPARPARAAHRSNWLTSVADSLHEPAIFDSKYAVRGEAFEPMRREHDLWQPGIVKDL